MNKIKIPVILFISTFILLNFSGKTQDYKRILENLDSYFTKSLTQWDVPGMAIGIVKNDSLIFAKGYGYRNIEKKAPVNPQTIFPIASNTKAYTAAAMGILVDEGKISWNTKVKDILPYFRLYNDYVTEHFTIADMLSHHSGLVTFSGDLLWYGSDYTREEVIKKLPLLKQKYEFRTTFGYSNIMYIAAGEVIAKVSGVSYEEFLQKHFFDKLAMSSTYTSITDLKNLDNVCTPYNKINDKIIPIELLNWDNIGGAGCINSNVADVSQWIKFQLHNGIWHGDTIVSPAQIREMRSPHTNFKVSAGYQKYWPSTHFRAYGMGWSVSDYHGRQIVNHSGGYDGVITFTCLVPEENLGFVILTNSNSSLYNALSYRILDAFLAKDTTDWSALFLPYQQRSEKHDAIKTPENASPPSLNLLSYTGLYHSELYGNAKITMAGKKLRVNLLHTPLWEGSTTLFDQDTFLIEFKKVPSLPQGRIYFTLNKKQTEVKSFVIDVPNPDFDFTEFEFIRIKEE